MSSITVEPLYNGHLWEPNFVRNSEVSLTKGFRIISGRHGMRNRAVERNVAGFSELFFGVRRQEMLHRG